LPDKSDPTYDEKLRRGDSICKLLNGIDYEIIGFEGKQNKLIDIKTVDDFDNNQQHDYVLVHRTDRGEIVNLFKNL